MIIDSVVIVAKYSARLVYFLLKLLPVQNKVILMSRRISRPSLDFKLLERALTKKYPDLKVIILCHPISHPVLYFFQLFQEMYHLATAKACVAESYVIPVSILRHRADMTVVQMWHALGAIKQFGRQILDRPEGSSSRIAKLMQMHQGYDYVLCGSEAMAPVFAEAFGAGLEKVKPIGLPRVDYLLDTAQRQRDHKAVLDAYPEIAGRKVILYVPTFRVGENVRIDDLIDKTKSLSEEYCLIIKYHLHDSSSVDMKDVIIDKKFDTDRLLAAADCVVTDYSAVMFEAAVADVPMYFYAYDLDDYQAKRGLNVDYRATMPGPVCQTADELIETIGYDAYNKDRLREFADTYVSVRDGSSSDKIIELLDI